MLAQPIARTLDLDNDAVVKKPIQQGWRDEGDPKNFPPFRKTAVGGEDHGALFVPGIDELEEQMSAARNDRQVADLVDDQEHEAAEEPDLLTQAALAFGLGKYTDEVGEGGEVDAAAGFDRLNAERHAQVTFAGAGRPDQMQDLGAVDELELGERHDAVLVERGLEGEVKAGERLDGGKARHDEGGFDAAVLAQGELLGEQGVDRFKRGHLPVIEAAHRGVEDFDRAWHLEGDHGLLDAVDHGGHDLGSHG